MRIVARIAVTLVFAMMIFGFRLLSGSAHWSVTPNDPTIWLKPCDAIANHKPTSMNVSAGDALFGASNITVSDVLLSIANDYIGVGPSYLRMALFPPDPNNPPATTQGDSPFTTGRAGNRTITICTGGTSGSSAGEARPTVSGGTITGCEILFGDKYLDDVTQMLHILTHEIGHCVGLAHPQEIGHAVMSYTSSATRLQDDDKSGVSFLYPRDTGGGGGGGGEHITAGFSCAGF